MMNVARQSDILVRHKIASPVPLEENLMDLVAEGLKLDFANLHVHWVVREVHLAANVEIDPL